MTRLPRYALAFWLIAVLAPAAASAQGAVADYERAMTLRDTYQGLAVNVPEQPTVDRADEPVLVPPLGPRRQRVRAGQRRDASEGSAVRSREAGGRHLVRDGRKVHRRHASVHHVHVRRQRSRDRVHARAGGAGGGAGRGAPPGGPGGPPMWRCSLDDLHLPAARGRGTGRPRGTRRRRTRPGRSGRSSTSTAPSRRSRPTKSSKRSSTTTTSRSARPASARSRCSARTDPKAATTIPTRWCGRPTRRRLPSTR